MLTPGNFQLTLEKGNSYTIGDDIPFVPNKRRGGVILGGVIAPIFFNTAQDSGALPLKADVTRMSTGDVILLGLFPSPLLSLAQQAVSAWLG